MADSYDRYRGVDAQVCGKLVEEITERTDKPQLSLLDVGCGTGSLTSQLAEKCRLSVTGIDVSREMLVQAKARYPEGHWILGDFETRKINSTYDIILLSYVLQHLKNQRGALMKAGELLNINGKLIIVTDDHDQFTGSIMCRFVPRIMEIDLSRFPAVDIIRGWLEGSGLRVHVHEVVRIGQFKTEGDVQDMVRKIRARYISTLTLLTEDEIEKGAEMFERYLLNAIRSGPVETRRVKTIIVAEKT